MKAFGATDSDGNAPINLQLSFICHHGAVRKCFIADDFMVPEQILCAAWSLLRQRCRDGAAASLPLLL
jgi:hypothetical protein